jgi:hypothetical protein
VTAGFAVAVAGVGSRAGVPGSGRVAGHFVTPFLRARFCCAGMRVARSVVVGLWLGMHGCLGRDVASRTAVVHVEFEKVKVFES